MLSFFNLCSSFLLTNAKHLVHLHVNDATKILLFVVKHVEIMAKVYEFLSNGFEDIEALAPVDILRRGGLEVKTVSITGEQMVETTHGIKLMTDLRIEDIADFSDVDAMLLPGGLPGATNLNKHRMLREILLEQYNQGRIVAAICAAPGLVLSQLDVPEGLEFTCFDGFQDALIAEGATFHDVPAVSCGRIVTGRSAGNAVAFGLAILEHIKGKDEMEKVKAAMFPGGWKQ